MATHTHKSVGKLATCAATRSLNEPFPQLRVMGGRESLVQKEAALTASTEPEWEGREVFQPGSSVGIVRD